MSNSLIYIILYIGNFTFIIQMWKKKFRNLIYRKQISSFLRSFLNFTLTYDLENSLAKRSMTAVYVIDTLLHT